MNLKKLKFNEIIEININKKFIEALIILKFILKKIDCYKFIFNIIVLFEMLIITFIFFIL